MSDRHRLVADATGGGGTDQRRADVDVGRRELRARRLTLRLALADLRAERGDATLLHRERGGLRARLIGGLARSRLQLGELRAGLRARRGKRAIARDLTRVVGRLGPRGGELRARLVDRGILLGDLRAGAVSLRRGDRDLRFRLRCLRAGAARVDPCKRLAGADVLVVGHQHLLDIARDPRRHDHHVDRDLRVVGLL